MANTTISLGGTRGLERPAGLWTLRLVFSVDKPTQSKALPVAAKRAVGRTAQGLAIPQDLALSREHAVFEPRAGGLHFQDRSRNGSYVNGTRRESALLADGDLVRLGNSLLVVRWQPLELAAWPLPELSGRSPAMRQARRSIQLVASEPVNVLLLGPSGSGKGAAARALHRLSGRPGELVHLNCSALPPGLAESTLFGHTKGAFTGASQSAQGRVAAAHRGTLFLDEVGDLPPSQQAKLLHVLDDGRFTPVGSSQSQRVDLRVLAATNLNLEEEVELGRFRADLYARLWQFSIHLPAVAERREDILALMGLDQAMSPDLAQALLLHPWPLNVRELQSVATELRLRSEGGRLSLALLAHRLQSPLAPQPLPSTGGPPDKAELRSLLKTHQGVVTQVARACGRSTKQVYRWLKAHGLEPQDYRG